MPPRLARKNSVTKGATTFLGRVWHQVCDACGYQRAPERKVRFQQDVRVNEFERQLGGGGGVPDGDAVALGLGPRCVATYLSPLAEKSDKDEYASSGYLTSSERTRLLSEWAPRPSIKAQLEQEVGPEMDKLHKARQECAASPKDQRYMPATLLEAQELGGLDAEAARKVATTRSRTKLAASCASPKGVTKKRRRSHA